MSLHTYYASDEFGSQNEPRRGPTRAAFTLLELLVATVVTLILTALVVQMFTFVSEGIFNSRANIELNDMLRNAKHQLIEDLRGVTAPTVPPLDPMSGLGYFEYVEGGAVANSMGGDAGGAVSTSTKEMRRNTISGDLDDILMFTTASQGDLYIGKSGTNSVNRSRFAEVAWCIHAVSAQPFFNLHRRVWLVLPSETTQTTLTTYTVADTSMRARNGLFEPFAHSSSATISQTIALNSLGDLTMRERRSIHQPYVWPYEMMYVVGTTVTSGDMITSKIVTLPTHGDETAKFANPISETKMAASTDPSAGAGPAFVQKWRGTASAPQKFLTGSGMLSVNGGTREVEDVVLTNVMSFDVKAWDPGCPVFRATPSTATNAVSNQSVVGLIVPGDPGYNGDGKTHNKQLFPMGALQNFINTPANKSFHPVAFGAYADLNYMWIHRESGRVNMERRAAYEAALKTLEKTIGGGTMGKTLPRPSFAFATPGRYLSGYPGHTTVGIQLPAVYDTWSTHYEYDGIDNDGDGAIDEGRDGIDNNGNGFIDEPNLDYDNNGIPGIKVGNDEVDVGEVDAPPPYDAPLRGIRVSIRVMEQDSRQVREVSTVHEFLPF